MFSSFGARMNDVRREKWVFRYKYINAFVRSFSPVSLFSFNPVETGDKRVSVKGGTLVSSRETFEAGFLR